MSIATVALSPVHEDNLKLACSLAGKYGSWSNDSILIFLTVGGSIIPLHVRESDSIASVKFKIQTFKGFFVKKQKLVFDGKELARNNSRVGDYGVADGNILHLVLRLSDLQAIIVRTVCGQEFNFHVDRNRNVGYVKQQIAKKGKGFNDLKEQELTLDGEELEDKRLIDNICKSNDAVIHLLVRKSAKVQAKAVQKDFEVSVVASASPSPSPSDENGSDAVEKLQERFQVVALNTVPRSSILEPLLVNPKITLSPVVKQLIGSTFCGIARGHQPIRSSEGSGGTYFMLDSRAQNYVSVFKPTDEEPMAVNNPRGLPLSVDGEGLKKGTRVGEGAFREVAAYILDHPKSGPRSPCSDEKGFAGVPPTLMVKCLHTGFNYAEGCEYSSKSLKIGSLQMFMKNNGSCEDIGPRSFTVDDVHRISVLDIRLANADRHAGNILVQKDDKDGHLVLIPIDHGYCLPENFEDCMFDWLYWPQAQQPYSAETLAYINSLDAEKDIELLKFHGWTMSLACARVLRISTMLLKKGAERGLTPFAIGSIMCRETLKKVSIIEEIVEEAEEGVLPGTSEATFLQSVSSIMDRRLDDLIKENV